MIRPYISKANLEILKFVLDGFNTPPTSEQVRDYLINHPENEYTKDEIIEIYNYCRSAEEEHEDRSCE